MPSITIYNDSKIFFEKIPGRIIIISANNSAYWISRYLKKFDIEFECFVDPSAKIEGELFNGVPVRHDYTLNTQKGGGWRFKGYYPYSSISKYY